MKRLTSFIACFQLAFVALSSASLWAATAAYWRHEEGTDDNLVAQGPDSVTDSSGNGNHMRTFGPMTAATYTTDVSPLELRSTLANNLALDFGPAPTSGTEDGGGKNDDNYTDNFVAPITTQLFTAMTVEFAFKMHTVDGSFQTLVGRDGKPLGDAGGEDDSPLAPLQIKVRGDNFPDAIPNQLQVEWIDGDGQLFTDIHYLASGETIVPDQWYHVAFTLTDSAAELWMAGETGDYVLKDALSGQDFAGSLGPGEVIVFDPTPFTVGRGMFGNGVADWSDALIDEVRISDSALTPNEFLFLTVPDEPGGDFDNDGDVDGRDFLFWQRGLSPSPLSPEDLADWQAAYDGGSLGALSVPEPSAMLLAACGLAALGLGKRG